MDIMEKSSDTGARLRSSKVKKIKSFKEIKRLEHLSQSIQQVDSWRKVSVDGKTGYVLKDNMFILTQMLLH